MSRSPRRNSRLEVFVALTVFITAFAYVLPEAAELIDDHFMHVAWGRQLLYGRRPLLDMEALGMPLQAALSALGELVVGYRLLSEGVILSAAFASAATLTFVIARRASRSLSIGVVAATLQLAVFPRTYSYPKLFVYAAAIALLWRYLDAPLNRRAAELGVCAAVAFFLRHDHGLYVGLVTLAILALRQRQDWRGAVSHLSWFGGVGVLVLTPYAAYIQHHWGVTKYTDDLRTLAVREHRQNRFGSLPRWPLSKAAEIAQWQHTPMDTATIGVRWNEASTDAERRTAAARYGIAIESDAPIESGLFLLTDVSTPSVLALLRDPVIDDTANVNRDTGSVPRQGLWIGSLHLLPGLDTPFGSAAFLFFAAALLLIVSLIALLRPPGAGSYYMPAERTKMAAVLLIGVVTFIGFIREPLAIRLPDAIVAPVILAAWCAGRGVVWLRETGHRWSRYVAMGFAGVVVLLITRSVVVVGAVPTRLERLTRPSTILEQLWVTPPVDAHTMSRTKSSAVRYIRACTRRSDSLLVLWFAPDLYYYSDRPFAGRLGFYMEGYWTSPDAARMNIAAIERDRPTIALIESGREATDLYTYPQLLAHIADTYHPLGALPSGDGRTIRVLARNDRVPSSIDAQLGWPCYS